MTLCSLLVSVVLGGPDPVRTGPGAVANCTKHGTERGMRELITVTFSKDSAPKISRKVWQYDRNQELIIKGLTCLDRTETISVHLSTQSAGGVALEVPTTVQDDNTMVLDIPDTLLENGDTTENYKIYGFVYSVGVDCGRTVAAFSFPVNARSKPQDEEESD